MILISREDPEHKVEGANPMLDVLELIAQSGGGLQRAASHPFGGTGNLSTQSCLRRNRMQKQSILEVVRRMRSI